MTILMVKEIGPHCFVIDQERGVMVYDNTTEAEVRAGVDKEPLARFLPTDQGIELAMVAAKSISLLRTISEDEKGE